MSILQYYTTHTGLRVIYNPVPSNVVYIGYSIATGSASDPKRYYGLAHCTEHMLFKGTTRRSALQLVHRIESVGGDINAFTTKDDTTLHAAIPAAYALRALHVLTDVITDSLIPEEELIKEQEVIIEEIKSYLDTPSERIFDEFEEHLFSGTPLAHNILGTETSVRRISAPVIRRFIDQYYQPDNMVLAIWGQIDIVRGLEIVEHLLDQRVHRSSVSSKPFVTTYQEDLASPSTTDARELIHQYDTNQCHCLIGGRAPALYSRDRYILTLFNNHIGGSAISSQLNLLLRERLGLVYTIESNYTSYLHGGTWMTYLGTGHDTLHSAISEVHDLIDHYVYEQISASELKATQELLCGQLLLSHDHHESELLSMLKSYLFFGKYNAIDEISAIIRSITPEEIHSVVKRYMDRSQRLTLIYR